MLSAITAIVEPWTPDPNRPTLVSSREFNQVDEFVATLAAIRRAPVPVVETRLSEAPQQGFVLAWPGSSLSEAFAEIAPETRCNLCRRLVWLNAGRTVILEEVEAFQPSCAVRVPQPLEHKVTTRVCNCTAFVVAAVNFDDDPRRRSQVACDVASGGHLPAKCDSELLRVKDAPRAWPPRA